MLLEDEPSRCREQGASQFLLNAPYRRCSSTSLMNDETKRGYRLFAQHHGARMGGLRRGEVDFSWDAMGSLQRTKWEQRATELAVAVEPVSPCKLKIGGKKKGRSWALEQRRMDFRPLDNDDDDEDDMGIPTEQLAREELDGHLEAKYEHDRRLLEETIMGQTGGCGDKIKRLRFLLASVQTFGNVDGECLMAEFAMNEFNLCDGVVDRISTLVGPWTVDNQIKRSRAAFHANETHRIPLNVTSGHLSMRELIGEILGRTEPTIAANQGIRVGLYKADCEDEEERLNRVFMGQKNMYHVVDGSSRRFIVCLRQEYEYILASMNHLKETVGLLYDGFPCTPDRFILADAFVDALASCLSGKVDPETAKWLSALGTPLPDTFATPWERNGELFCGRHRNERNSCCATVTASRASFIILYSLEQALKEL